MKQNELEFINFGHRNSGYMNCCVALMKHQMRHPSCAQLSHLPIFGISLFEPPIISASSRSFSRRSSNTILWIFLTVSGVDTSIGRPQRCSSWQLVRLCLNSDTKYITVVNEGTDFPRVKSSLALILVRL